MNWLPKTAILIHQHYKMEKRLKVDKAKTGYYKIANAVNKKFDLCMISKNIFIKMNM